MKGRKSFFIAFAVIALPVILYFLGRAGKQHYESLPYYGERIPPDGTTVKDTIYYKIPDFSLTSQTGTRVTLRTFDNSIFIANFFFASCKDICPAMNAKVKTVYDRMQEQKFSEVKFLSITVDPENDTPEALAAYAKKLNADPAIWYFATGTKEAIYKTGQGFLLPVAIEDQTVDHSQQLLLIDKDHHIRGIYNGLDELDIKRLNEEIKVLLYEYHRSSK